jgi:hypothetical protein
MNRRHTLVFILVLLPAAAPLAASECRPPVAFVDTAAPVILEAEHLVSHTESATVERPFVTVLRAANRPLSAQIQDSKSLPGVTGSFMLTPGEFGAVGSRRLNCLSDGSTLVEQVLESGSHVFRYIVWNYTSEKARPVRYGVGHFEYFALDPAQTRVDWTYSFALDESHFPGRFGPLGRWLFRRFFLEREYAVMMRGVLQSMRRAALAEPTALAPGQP